jgi:predicted MFS family arabinose efflux permease
VNARVIRRRSTHVAKRQGDARDLSWVGIAVLIVCVFMPQVDYFIVNVALPTIDRSLHASSGALELLVAGYGTAYAALLVVSSVAA